MNDHEIEEEIGNPGDPPPFDGGPPTRNTDGTYTIPDGVNLARPDDYVYDPNDPSDPANDPGWPRRPPPSPFVRAAPAFQRAARRRAPPPARRRGVTCNVKRMTDGSYTAIIRFPINNADGPAGKPASVGAAGVDARAALTRAATLAKQITESPIFAAVAPPGTAAAIKALAFIAKAPNPRKIVRRFAGPGARRLAKALSRLF